MHDVTIKRAATEVAAFEAIMVSSVDRATVATGSLREVSTLAWPTIVGMLSFTLMEVADTYFVGRLGTVELAAIGISTMLVFVLHSFCFGLVGAARVVIAQLDGAGQRTRFSNGAGTALMAALFLGALFFPLRLVSDALFAALGGSPDVQRVASEYFDARLLGSWAFFAMTGMGNVLKGTGDTRTPMRVNLVVNGLNIGLDPLFIYGWGPVPAMRHIGAAHATTFALLVGFCLMLYAARKRFPGSWKPDMELIWSILRYGVPMGIQWMLEAASWVVFLGIMARISDAALAANTAVMKILTVSFLPGYGIAEAANVLAGRYAGSGRNDLIRVVWKNAVFFGAGLMGAMGLLFLIAPELLIGIFADDPEIIRIGSQFLRIAAVFQIVDAMGIISSNTLTGTGDTRFTLIVSLSSAWLIFVPAAWYLATQTSLGAVGAWYGLTLHLAVLASVCAWRIFQGGWQGRTMIRTASVVDVSG